MSVIYGLPQDVYAPPPFTLADIRAAVPEHCWKRDTVRSFAYLARDVAVVIGLAAAAAAINSWCARSSHPLQPLRGRPSLPLPPTAALALRLAARRRTPVQERKAWCP